MLQHAGSDASEDLSTDGNGIDEREKGSSLNNSAALAQELECPLFMDGLPDDFEGNPSLAALASLLVDDDNSKKEQPDTATAKGAVKLCMSGGGKVSRKKGISKRSIPYSKYKGSKKTSTSIAETQLFLKMWKL